jgi:hypothetical protein
VKSRTAHDSSRAAQGRPHAPDPRRVVEAPLATDLGARQHDAEQDSTITAPTVDSTWLTATNLGGREDVLGGDAGEDEHQHSAACTTFFVVTTHRRRRPSRRR